MGLTREQRTRLKGEADAARAMAAAAREQAARSRAELARLEAAAARERALQQAAREVVAEGRRGVARRLHPDVGGSADAMALHNEAADLLLRVTASPLLWQLAKGGL